MTMMMKNIIDGQDVDGPSNNRALDSTNKMCLSVWLVHRQRVSGL